MEPNTRCFGADFCHELSGGSDTEFNRVYQGDPPNRTVWTGRSLSLLADLSPLCVGHLLIVSNVHRLSFAEMIIDHGAEIEDSLAEISCWYRSAFGEPIVMEHGSTWEMEGSSCITHAHWHLLPLDLDMVHAKIIEDRLEVTELSAVSDLASVAAGGHPYFYCADKSRYRVYATEQRLRRQYLRSVAGTLLGISDPEWDYAVTVRKNFLRQTLVAVSDWRIGWPSEAI